MEACPACPLDDVRLSLVEPDASLTRSFRGGKLACPDVLRLIHFTLVMNPSTKPLLQDSVQPLATACASSAVNDRLARFAAGDKRWRETEKVKIY
jgi:hypothetical protein